jgi:predicted DNA-binding protein
MEEYKKKYAMVQLPKETHDLLKKYCEQHGFTQSGLVSAIIKQYILKPKK